MHELIALRLGAMFQRWADLLEALPEGALSQKLPAASNSIGGQFWCVIGARESYARAIAAGSWQGFDCSLSGDAAQSRDAVRAALRSSAEAALAAAAALATDAAAGAAQPDAAGPGGAREGLLLDLLEHEAQHQGQLIRYVYALGYSFPETWKQRWALS
ncbi:DinB family protein [bacterium]|nr:DinB family protein [bacterium]